MSLGRITVTRKETVTQYTCVPDMLASFDSLIAVYTASTPFILGLRTALTTSQLNEYIRPRP